MNTTSTSNQVVLSIDSTTSKPYIEVSGALGAPVCGVKNRKKTENAIYAYIRAIRALGREKVNTADIASALSITVQEVNRSLSVLKKKGVKTLHV